MMTADMTALRGLLDAGGADPSDPVAWSALADWGEEAGRWRGPLDGAARKAHAAREAYLLTAATPEGRARLEGVELHHDGYAETGYADPPSGVIATGNWNAVTRPWAGRGPGVEEADEAPRRLGDLLEALGVECEWSDEWADCADCGALVRTVEDSYDWRPSYRIEGGEILCLACAGEHAPEGEDEE